MAEWKYIQEVNTLSGKEYLNFINSPNCLQRKNSIPTRNIYLAAVFTFYAMNNSTLNKKKIYRYLWEQTRIHRDRPYATEEIRRLLHGSDLLLRSIVLLLSSCRCRQARSYNDHRHQ